jgi:hypothetical protein
VTYVLAAVAASLLSTVGMTGCGVSWASPNRPPLWGTVNYNGKPVENAVIVFMPADRGKTTWGAGRIDKGGRFSLSAYQAETGLDPGPYNIFFRTAPANVVATRAKQVADAEQDPKQVQAVTFALPEKYTGPKTSGLEFTFDGRPQRIDLDMKD